jgi:hypothetical protein
MAAALLPALRRNLVLFAFAFAAATLAFGAVMLTSPPTSVAAVATLTDDGFIQPVKNCLQVSPRWGTRPPTLSLRQLGEPLADQVANLATRFMWPTWPFDPTQPQSLRLRRLQMPAWHLHLSVLQCAFIG